VTFKASLGDDIEVTITASLKEFSALYNIVEDYKAVMEERYDFPTDLATLFTQTQLEIFRAFDATFDAIIELKEE
jgi:uncharacterized protein YydD (DUF2326 family)